MATQTKFRYSYPVYLLQLLQVEKELRPSPVNYRALVLASALVAAQFWNPEQTLYCDDTYIDSWVGPACKDSHRQTFQAVCGVLPLPTSYERFLRVAVEALLVTPEMERSLRLWSAHFLSRAQRMLHSSYAKNREAATRLLFHLCAWTAHQGTLIISIPEMAAETGLSDYQVKRGLKALRDLDLIGTKRLAKRSSLLRISLTD